MTKRAFQYGFLTIIILALLVTAYLVQSRSTKSILILLIAALYFIFGIFHHLEEKTFHSKVVWEYLAMSLLVFVILFSLLVGRI